MSTAPNTSPAWPKTFAGLAYSPPGRTPVELESPVHPGVAVELDAAHAHLFRVGKVTAQHPTWELTTWVWKSLMPVLNTVTLAVTPRNGSVFTPASKWRTSSGLTVAVSRRGRPRASVGRPFRFRPTDLKLVE